MRRIFYVFLLTSIVLNAQVFENFTSSNSKLPEGNITSISIGYENSIWISSETGIAVYDGFSWLTFIDSLGGGFINDLILTGNDHNTVWIADSNGVRHFQIKQNSVATNITHLDSTSGIISNIIKSLAVDNDSIVWLGTDNGVSILDNQSVTNHNQQSGEINFNSNKINDIAVSNDTVKHKNIDYIPNGGVLYFATAGGGISRAYNHIIDGVTSASIIQTSWSGLISNDVLTVHIDYRNNHWYGTEIGAASHWEHDSKNAKWKYYTENNGLVNNYVTAITSDTLGNVWFGTRGGISHFNNGIYNSYTKDDGLVSNYVNDIKIDYEGNVWVATDEGVSKLSNSTSVSGNTQTQPINFKLNVSVYPNPFNPSTKIRVEMSEASNIKMMLYSLNGELIDTIYRNFLSAGIYEFNWSSRESDSNRMVSGIYFLVTETSRKIDSQKIILLK